MADSSSGVGNAQDELKHCDLPQGREAIQGYLSCGQKPQGHLEEAPWSKGKQSEP